MSSLFRFLPAIAGGNVTIPPPSGPVGSVTSLQLINATTDAVIGSDLANNDTIDISSVNRSIKATTTGSIGSLVFKVEGCETHINNHYSGAVYKLVQDRFEDYDGLETMAIALTSNNSVTREAKIQQVRDYVRDNSVTRPFDYGYGIYDLEVIPYSGANKTGTKGTSFIITLEFHGGTPSGKTPTTHNVSTWSEFLSLLPTLDDFDKVIFAPGTYAVTNINLTKKIKLIGSGKTQTFFTGFDNWTIQSGCTLSNFSITGGTGTALSVPNGLHGVFLHNIKSTGKTRLIAATFDTANTGLVADGVECYDCFGGSISVFGFTRCQCRHFNLRNIIINNIQSTSTTAQGMRLGSDNYVGVNQDIILYNIKIDTVGLSQDGDQEVHGIYAFGDYIHWEKVWVKNIIPRRNGSTWWDDREAMGGKVRNSIFIDCWADNPGAVREEGAFNCKNEVGRNVFIGNLVTVDNKYRINGVDYTDCHHGYAINSYGAGIRAGNKFISGQTIKGFAFAYMQGTKQVDIGNEIYLNNHVFIRLYNEPSEGTGNYYASDNFGAIYSRYTNGTAYPDFWKGNPSTRDFTVSWQSTNNICPSNTNPNGGANCAPGIFDQPNWPDGHKLA